MNLRSAKEVTELHELKFEKKTKKKKNPEKDMAATGDIQQMFDQLKESLLREFKDLKDELKEFRQESERDIKSLMQTTKETREKVESMGSRIDHLEERVSHLDDCEAGKDAITESMLSRIDKLTDQVNYLENKSRQNNVCFYNVAEKSEDGDMKAFLKQFVTENIGVTEELDLVRAHRTQTVSGDSARPIIVAFRDFEVKQKVLQTAWQKGEIIYKDQRIFLDNDYTYKVRQERALYKPIRLQLKERNVKSHILPPAKLKVFNSDGSTTTFSNAAQAAKELKRKGLYDG